MSVTTSGIRKENLKLTYIWPVKTILKKGETPKGFSKGKREIIAMVPNMGTPRISENKSPGRINSRYKVGHKLESSNTNTSRSVLWQD